MQLSNKSHLSYYRFGWWEEGMGQPSSKIMRYYFVVFDSIWLYIFVFGCIWLHLKGRKDQWSISLPFSSTTLFQLRNIFKPFHYPGKNQNQNATIETRCWYTLRSVHPVARSSSRWVFASIETISILSFSIKLTNMP